MIHIPFKRGDIWLVNFVPARGHEQDGQRPAAILSIDGFNNGHAGLLVVAPLTSKGKGIPYHVLVRAPEGGLRIDSYIMCDQVVTVSHNRVEQHWGSLSTRTIALAEDRLRVLLGL